MIYIPAALIGGVIGGLSAKRRGGTGLDIAQYVAVYAIAFGLLGLIVTIILDRNGVFG